MMVYYILLLAALLVITAIIWRRNKKRHRKETNINPDLVKEWKNNRRNRKSTPSINVKAISDNINQSYNLWKKLSIIVHEAKWINESVEKQSVASELRGLVNANKNNYKALKEIELEIEKKLQ